MDAKGNNRASSPLSIIRRFRNNHQLVLTRREHTLPRASSIFREQNTICRLDKVKKYSVLNDHFYLPYRERFEGDVATILGTEEA